MNRWYDSRCRYGCGVWVWQYEPGGRYWEREPGQKEKPHTCKRPTTKDKAS